MAITVISEPATFEPIYNYLNYKVSSTNSGAAQFKYLYDVYIDSVFITRVANSPAPDGYGYFDASRIVEAYVSQDISSLLTDDGTPAFKLPNSYIEKLQIKFGEQYFVTSLETHPDLTLSDISYPFNAALKYLDRAAYSQATYLMNGSQTSKFLTNFPREIYLTRDQRQFLTLIRSAIVSGVNESYRVRAYDISDTNIFNWIVNTNIASNNDGGRSLRIPIGYSNLSEVSDTHVTGDDWSDFNAPEVSYYTIQLWNTNSSLPASELITVKFKEDICRYTPKEIYFQNKFGAFETFVFQLVNTERVNASKTFYTKANSISQLNYSQSDRRQTVLNVNQQTSYTADSNWLSEDESLWLQELISSPVAMLREGNLLIPINITNESYSIENKERRKLFKIQIQYQLTVKDDTQRG
jgi:hypothetical protein